MSTEDESEPGGGAAETAAPVASSTLRVPSLGAGAELVLHVLAAGFYVTLWGLVAALVGLAAWFASDPAPGTGWVPEWMPAWALAFWCAFTALFLVLAQFGLVRQRGGGRPLRRDEAPAFFAVLDEVAARMGLGHVAEIRLKPAPIMAAARVRRPGRFAITERRALVVGVPLLRALSIDDLRGAVAHEFAHLLGGDLRRGRVVHAAWRRLTLMRSVLERGRGPARALLTWLNPVWWYVVAYSALLRRGAAVVRRRQEARADRLAADAVGRAVYARSLVRVAEAALAFRRLAPTLIVRAAESGSGIRNFYAELAVAAASQSHGARRRLLRDALAEHDEDATDHPPLSDRLDALGLDLPEPGEWPDETAASLLPGIEQIEASLTPLVLRGIAIGMGPELRRRRELHRTAQGTAGAD